ncbi:hypothetical protein [Vibrio sp. DNB22_12_1]
MINKKYSKNLILKITPANSIEISLDFNRLRYSNIPQTKRILSKIICNFIERDHLIQEIFNAFKLSDKSHSTLLSLYNALVKHFRFSDKNKIPPLIESSMLNQVHSELRRFQKGEIKSSLYTKLVSEFSSILSLMDIQSDWINELPRLYKSDTESFESYSQEELKIILPPLRKLFSQLSKQFLQDPEEHMSAYKNLSTMSFEWKGETYKICGGISKIMASATFLLSYYTWSNTSVLFNLKRPKVVSYDMSKSWYVMPAFKRRAFKTISVEIANNQTLEVPKFSLSFFDTLLNISKIIDDSDDAPLFQRVIANERSRITSPMLSSFNQFMEKTLKLRGKYGQKIPYQISRFRETGAQTFMVKGDTFETALLLDNQPNTVKKHYSKGNKIENRAMMQDSTSVLEIQSRNQQSVVQAINQRKSELNVKVLTLEEKVSTITRNVNGTYCSNPFGREATSFSKSAESHKLIKTGEKLACADILKCFSCQHQVVVQSAHDIWCLLSFKECIEESISFHINAQHFMKNFQDILDKIENIIKKINSKTLRQAEKSLNTDGRHPLWQDSSSLGNLGATK